MKYTKPPLKDSVLHLAARRKDNDLVKLFIEAGAGVDVKNVRKLALTGSKPKPLGPSLKLG